MKLDLQRIRSYAEQKGVSLRQIAMRIDMTPTGFLRSIDKSTMSAQKVVEVCNILEIRFEDLVDNPNEFDTDSVKIPSKVESSKITEEEVEIAVKVFRAIGYKLLVDKK